MSKRTYRHNQVTSERAGPELCDLCDRTPAIRINALFGFGKEYTWLVCEECEADWTDWLRRTTVHADVTVIDLDGKPLYGFGT